jgi:hypothetical protein
MPSLRIQQAVVAKPREHPHRFTKFAGALERYRSHA